VELIYANHKREDVGILKNPDLDLAFGGDENNFECTVGIKDHCCEDGFYIYAEGTEYGGIVDAIKIDSADDTVTYSGRTWHGMLASKMIEPLKNGEETGGGGGGTASRLPEGYTEVEYIKSSGTQYIDTGFVPNQDTRVVCDAVFSPEGTSSQYFFGVRVSSTSRQFGLRGTASGYQIKYGNVDGGTTSGVETGRILIDFNKNKLSVGSLSLSNDYTTFTCPGNMYLFAANNNGAVYANCTATVYSMQIYDNGVLVRDFIPCKNASGVAGLYDVVGGKFYGNAGSGSFAVGADVRVIVLPKGYKRREYIESTGTQYIDTGFMPTNNTRVVLDAQYTTLPTSLVGLVGCIKGTRVEDYSLWVFDASEKLYDGYGNVSTQPTVTGLLNRRVYDKNKNVTKVDGVVITTHSANTFTAHVNMYILAMNENGKINSGKSSARIYSCQIYENGTLVRDFVPCENDSGVIGLYDLVESKFYGNAGSGTFVGGAEIETPTVEEPAAVVVEAEDENGESYVDKYLVISGDANFCVKYILDRINLAPLFVAVEDAAGVNVEKHRFDPYLDAYTGLCEMLEKVGLRLQTECFDGVVTLSAVPIFDFSADQEMESDLVEYQMTKKYRKVNHLICIGYSGTVVHLYVDEEGHISEEQTFVGVEEYTAVNGQKSEDEENSGASTGTDERADLIANGKKVLAGMLKANTITVQFEPTDDTYYVGDIVGAYDRTTDISVSARVNKKILSLVNGRAEIEYKVGD
jgi:hypothetical protein